MRGLSNFFRSRDDEAAGSTVCRLVRKSEIEPALRLILSNDQGLAGDDTVLDFLSFAVQRKIDLDQMWVGLAHGRIVWASLPIASPGRTMLIYAPSHLPQSTPIELVRDMTEQICQHWKARGMHLAQFLLDPNDTAVSDLQIRCGFEVLAELLYLNRTVREAPPIDLPPGFELSSYSPQTHASFANAIQQSYQGSLDCPALNGKRSVEDVIAGHKGGGGGFEPRLWHLLTEAGEPRGVLILSPCQHSDSVELVYLGLTPAARKRGLGDLMMRLAMHQVVSEHRSELSLAVDSRNLPAMRLYFRHGMKRIGSRLALVRDLRQTDALGGG